MIKKRITNILIPIDGSKNSLRALGMGIYLAKTHKANLFGLHVIDLQTVFKYSALDPIAKRFELEAKQIIKKVNNNCSKNHVSFSSKILHGRTGPSIVKFAQKQRFDIIVIGARGLGSFSGMVLGSVSNYIVQKSKIPVLIIK
jgi:nucleotide-binding universal stress UspA family protein